MSQPLFEQVGRVIEFDAPQISNDEAEMFRVAALNGLRVRSLQVEDDTTEFVVSSYATGVLSDASGDYDVAERMYSAKSHYGSSPDIWNATMAFSRYNSTNNRLRISNLFNVNAINGEVQSAVRIVRIVGGLSRMAIGEDGQPFEHFVDRHKTYQKPLTPEMLRNILSDIERINARASLTRKR